MEHPEVRDNGSANRIRAGIPEEDYLRYGLADLNYQEDPSVGYYAVRAISLARRSGFISGAIVTHGNDEHIRSVADFYFSEKNQPVDNGIDLSDIVEAVDDLALAMEPEVMVYLHLVRESEMALDALRKTTIEEARRKGHSVLLDEVFSPTIPTVS